MEDNINKQIFTFVLSSFNYGGIEVLISRILPKLEKNYEVHLFLLTEKFDVDLLDKLNGSVKIHTPKDFLIFKLGIDIAACNAVSLISNIHKSIIINSKHLHVADSHCLVFAASNLSGIKKSITVGNYHSQEYVWSDSWTFRQLEEDLVSQIAPGAMICFNQISVDKLAEKYGKKFFKSKIVPAGIDIPDRYDLSPRDNHLVCVSRLVKFKSYIEQVIKEIPKILTEHPDFEFHIYGLGDDMKRLKMLSKGLPVVFKGALNVDELNSTISKYKLFIGSGTSILTSSSLGVPSIIGIESISKPVTYGFLYETKGFDYQEIGLDYPYRTVISKINEVLNSDVDNYANMCRLSRMRAYDFSIDKTIEAISSHVNESSLLFNKRSFSKIRYLYSAFFWSLINKLGFVNSKKNRHHIS